MSELKPHSVNRDLIMAKKVAEQVDAAGGRTFYVGGFVRDKILGKENKDIDIEIHGITPEKLCEILDSVGKRTEMGASFGIYGLRGCDLDIAMPRMEEATGRGHRDFAVFVDPFLGTEKAARRRDFTINAMMEDVLTGEVVDHFGGVEDLKNGIIRHVNPDTFVEDPLRVLRGAQFAARFEFTIAEETVELSRNMDLTALASERILGELEKALLKAARPSVFFEEMRKMEQLDDWFPEVKALIGVPQEPAFHLEGDVWNHTMLVLDQAAGLREQAANPLGFMLAALTHDFGKVSTTELIDGRIRSFGHDTEGIPVAKAFLQRITNEVKLNRYVLNLVEHHMKPHAKAMQKSGIKSTNKMFDQSVDPAGLILLARADHLGRPGFELDEEIEDFLWERLDIFKEMMARPFVMGADLVAAGLKPGPEFSGILAFAHKLRLAGMEKESALKQTLAYARELK